MTRLYRVTVIETVTYDVEVEAASEAEAIAAAPDIWAQSEDPDKDFNGTGHGVEAADTAEDLGPIAQEAS